MVDEIQIASKAGFKAGRKFQREKSQKKPIKISKLNISPKLLRTLRRKLEQRRKAPDIERLIVGKQKKAVLPNEPIQKNGFFKFTEEEQVTQTLNRKNLFFK